MDILKFLIGSQPFKKAVAGGVKRVAPIAGETALNSLSRMANYDEGDLLDFARHNIHETFDPEGRYADATQFGRNMAYAALNPIGTIADFITNPLVMNPEAMRSAQSEFDRRQKEIAVADELWNAYQGQTIDLAKDMFAYIKVLKDYEKKTGKKFTPQEWSNLLKQRRQEQGFTNSPITRQNNFRGRPTWSGSIPQPTSAGMLNMMPNPDDRFRRPVMFNNPEQFDTYRTKTEGLGWRQKEDAMRAIMMRNMQNPQGYRPMGGY